MPYDWMDFTHPGSSWDERFPPTARGGPEWRGQVLSPTWTPPLLPALTPPTQPCVFVSHRNHPTDRQFALRIAEIAYTRGYDYWLDVLNPPLVALSRLRGTVIPPSLRAATIAAIIEMGLLNSTHVIVVQTIRAAGSEWIPYEYGRAKPRTPRARGSRAPCGSPR